MVRTLAAASMLLSLTTASTVNSSPVAAADGAISRSCGVFSLNSPACSSSSAVNLAGAARSCRRLAMKVSASCTSFGEGERPRA